MTRARRTSRRRSNTPTVRSVALKGFATLGVIAAFVALAVSANKGTPGRDYSTMYVAAANTGSLRGHDKVAIGGVRVGQVVEVTPMERGARVELQLEPGVRLPADSTVRLRANGLLGARYVQLIPGSHRRTLADGSTLRADADALSATVPDVLDVFDAETRGALGMTVRGLGRGLLGNGAPLNDAIRVASDATVPFSAIIDSVLARDGAAGRLVPSLHSAVRPLDESRRELAAMFAPADIALRPFADRRDALRDTLDVAPSSLSAATAGLRTGTRLLAATGELARSAHRTLPAAPAGLHQATALLREAREGRPSPLQRATSLLRAVPSAVPATLAVTTRLRPLLPLLDDALGSLRPIVSYAGKYGCDIVNTGVTLRSMTGFVGTGEGPNGPSSQFRLQALGAPETLGIKDPSPTRDAYHAPCTYLGGTYDVTPLTGLGRAGR